MTTRGRKAKSDDIIEDSSRAKLDPRAEPDADDDSGTALAGAADSRHATALRRQIATLQGQLADAQRTLARELDERVQDSERIEALQAELAPMRAAVEQARQEAQDARADVERERASMAAAADSLEAARAEADALKETISKSSAAAEEAVRTATEEAARVDELERELADMRKEYVSRCTELEAAHARHTELELALADAQGRSAGAVARSKEIAVEKRESERMLAGELSTTSRERDETRNELDKTRAALAKAAAMEAELKATIASLRSSISAVERIEENIGLVRKEALRHIERLVQAVNVTGAEPADGAPSANRDLRTTLDWTATAKADPPEPG